MQRPPGNPPITTCRSHHRQVQCHRGRANRHGHNEGGGCLTPREQQTTPFKKGLLQKREASHMCKTHLVKINTGFVFSIKNKNKKNQ